MARLVRRLAKAARRSVTVPGVLIAVVGVAVLGSPTIAQAAVNIAATPAATAQHAATAGQASTARSASTAGQADPARPAAPGGICQVPGIGDIGGLLGFCAAGSSGLIGDLNNICQPSVPAPEPAAGGIDSLIQPPAAGKQPPTLYQSYGMAGQSWAAYDMQCSDMTSLVGNSVAGMVFDASKALDRVTITVYQSAAGEGILSWLTGAVDRLITSLGNAVYFPYLAPVVILGAIWLAWQGLIRKRATRTIEGTIWMVVACAAAIWLIGRPADFTGLGKTVSDGITQTLNVAFAGLPAPAQSNCVPVAGNDPQVAVASFSYTAGTSIVDQNANELWTVLVCKPWLDGEFGTTTYATGKGAKPTVVNDYARQLLWSQAIATNEKATPSLITAKEDAYAGIAASIKQNDPAIYPLFQGNQYPTRLEIAFAALFAALVAGVLVLLIAITLIILKLGFLLLLVAGPFFLIVGTHPGFGRVVALRWVEMLVGVLLKQAAIALVLSVLLYAYSLIMGTSDAALPWALKILMIALVTVAVFIYRKPFVHLFSAVGYGMVGSRERSDTELVRAGDTARRNTLDAATVGVPGFAAYRAARWARRNPAQAAGLAAQVATAGAAGAAAAGATAAAGTVRGEDGLGTDQSGAAADGPADEAYQDGSARTGLAARGRGRAAAGAEGSPRSAPPLDLPARDGNGQRPLSGWSRAGAGDTAAGRTRRAGGEGQQPDAAPGAAPAPPARGGAAPPARTAAGAPPRSAPAAPPAAAPPPPQAAPRQAAARRGWPGVSPRHPRGTSGAAAPSQPQGAAPPGFGAGPSRAAPPSRSAPPPSSAPSGGSGPFSGAGPSRSAAPPLRARGSGPGASQSGTSRPGPGSRPAAPPGEADEGGRGPAGGDTSPPVPFWLRPVRRKK
ncbi:MAG TPA: type IV secretion system protein [Streptosporangiaceae bacterium]|nr:type IV secretion system protein [Streptosporangiaceae bacterium]